MGKEREKEAFLLHPSSIDANERSSSSPFRSRELTKGITPLHQIFRNLYLSSFDFKETLRVRLPSFPKKDRLERIRGSGKQL